MEKKFYQDFKLGILGGGQLGRMLIQAATDLNVQINILDPDADAPCSKLAHKFVQGALTDYQTVYDFGKEADIITIEIENVNVEALFALQKEGKKIYPQPEVVRIVQDKRVQKEFYRHNGIPTADFVLIDHKQDIAAHTDFIPGVLKMGKAGYDGKGVLKIRSIQDVAKAFDAPSVLEKHVAFEKELSVLVARNAKGEISTYPIVELVFNPTYNLVDYLFAPANISPEIEIEAANLAGKIITRLDMVGLLAVELFLTKDGTLLVNEIAPRPHNSGHHTIEASVTSQFHQHLRAVLNLPLGSAKTICLSAMVNLIGEDGYNGVARYEGLEALLAMEGVYPHIYGKRFTKPSRKMGHITVTATSQEVLFKKIETVKSAIRVIA